MGDGPAPRPVAAPHSHLHLGIFLLVATVGFDRLRAARADGDR